MYAQVANRLAQLIDDVYTVHVDPDEKRELLTLYVTGRDHTPHPARALSDGTLRFLALAVAELDPESQGLLCLEEPENGIHQGKRFNRVSFAALPDTWREKAPEGTNTVSRGKLLAYLNPIPPPEREVGQRRVADRSDLQMLLPFADQASLGSS